MDDQPLTWSATDVNAPTAVETFSWVGLIGTIVIFLIILLVALWLIKKISRHSNRYIDSPWIRILDRQVLQGQQCLYLVEIAGKIQVLAATDHHLSVVAEINSPEVVAEIFEEIATAPQPKGERFWSELRRRVRRNRTKNPFSAELEQLLKEARK